MLKVVVMRCQIWNQPSEVEKYRDCAFFNKLYASETLKGFRSLVQFNILHDSERLYYDIIHSLNMCKR